MKSSKIIIDDKMHTVLHVIYFMGKEFGVTFLSLFFDKKPLFANRVLFCRSLTVSKSGIRAAQKFTSGSQSRQIQA
jgi:hypothetical protein